MTYISAFKQTIYQHSAQTHIKKVPLCQDIEYISAIEAMV